MIGCAREGPTSIQRSGEVTQSRCSLRSGYWRRRDGQSRRQPGWKLLPAGGE